MEEQLSEVVQFLHDDKGVDLKCAALEMLLGLTGSHEGSVLLLSSQQLLESLLRLLPYRKKKKPEAFIARDAALIFLNLSSLANAAVKLSELESGQLSFLSEVLYGVEEKESVIADQCCMILANISRSSTEVCSKIFEEMRKIEFTFEKLVRIFCEEKYNTEGASMHYIGPFISNMTQLPEVRRCILDSSCVILQRLLPFTVYAASAVRRGGVIGCLKNCCFDTATHGWLLSNQVDLLPHLLLPLAGPEELKDEENEELPPDLQYLGSDKEREQDPDIRKIILEALLQLCATRKGREILRNNGTYYIARELHKWEKDPACVVACENLVDIMIKKEEEIGHDNLKELEVPTDLTEKFELQDGEYIKSLVEDVTK